MGIFLSKKMQYFLIVMETKCLTDAAEILHITRSPLGKSIVDLEESLGKKLFIRKGNRIEPTEIAIALYKKIKPLSEALLQIEYDFASRNHSNRLKLIIDSTIPAYIAAGFEPLMKIKDFNLSIERIDYTPTQLEEMLLEGKSAFLTIRQDWGGLTDDYHVEYFPPVNLYIACANNLYNQHASLSELLIKTPIIKSDFISDTRYYNVLKKHIPDLGDSVSFIHGNFDIIASLNLVASGKATMVLTESLLKYCHPQVKTIRIDGLKLEPKLIYSRKHRNNNEYKSISEFIKKNV